MAPFSSSTRGTGGTCQRLAEKRVMPDWGSRSGVTNRDGSGVSPSKKSTRRSSSSFTCQCCMLPLLLSLQPARPKKMILGE